MSESPAVHYVPANRNNVVGMFALGLLCSSHGLARKYYRDPLGDFGGYLPLLESNVFVNVWQDHEPADPGAFRVILELNTGSNGLMDEPGDAGIVLLPGVLPTTVVERLHFHTETDRSEFAARSYDNFDASAIPTTVSPELFTTDSDNDTTATPTVVHELPGAPPDASAFDSIDALAGAIAFIAAAGPINSGSSKRVTRLLETYRKSTVVQGIEWFLDQFMELAPSMASNDANWLIARAALEGARSRYPEVAAAPRALLDSVRSRIEAEPTTPETLMELTGALDFIDQILSGQQTLVPFRTDGGLPAARGLLLHLLRPRPEQAAALIPDEHNAGTDALLLSFALSGIGSGYRRLPLDLRGGEAFSGYITSCMADQLNGSAQNRLRRFAPPRATISTNTDESAHCTTIRYLLRKEIILERTAPPPTLRSRILSSGITDSNRQDAVRIARAMDWNDIIRTRVRTTANHAEVAVSPSGELEIVIDGDAVVQSLVAEDTLLERVQRIGSAELEAAVDTADDKHGTNDRQQQLFDG